MNTQIHIGKTGKGILLILFLFAVSFGSFAQQAGKNKIDKKVTSTVKGAWYDLDKLADSNEKVVRYKAPVNEDELSTPIILAGSTQERNEMLGSSEGKKNLIEVGYYQKAKTTGWYKIRKIFTDRSAENCQACIKVVSTPYVLSRDF